MKLHLALFPKFDYAVENNLQAKALPFGNFHMNKEAVKGVIKAGRLEENRLSQKADTYLKFGLPRMAVHGQSIGDSTLRTNIPLQGAMFGDRKSRSEWDLTGLMAYQMAEEVIGTQQPENHWNSFLQSARHHAQYFSNLDLFQQPSGFNYLRYAKAEELRQESSRCVIYVYT
ncbi:unnamed protein product [Anisakis simplex]|uniref:Beta-glucosidase n=1 Tax=Anisakis simplex TaxID=6269 RepID=A0A0M3KFN1_ANISI|nr:unnamed protein product [Anisakis simplex]